MLVIFLLKLPQLHSSLGKFKLRLSHLQTLVHDAQNQETQKCYIINSEELNEKMLLTWGIPIETALLSSLTENGESTSIKVFDRGARVSTATDSLHTAFKFLSLEEINPDYFHFSNTSKYELLNRK